MSDTPQDPQVHMPPPGVTAEQFRDAWRCAMTLLSATWHGVPLDIGDVLAECDAAVLVQALVCNCLSLMMGRQTQAQIEATLREWGAAVARLPEGPR